MSFREISDTILFAVGVDGLQWPGVFGLLGEKCLQFRQGHDAGDCQAEILLHFLDRGAIALATLLAVQCDDNSGGCRTVGGNNVQRFANGCAGSDDVVDNKNAPLQCGADQIAAFTVVFGFLAVETVRYVTCVVIGQRNAGSRCQRNTFIGGAEQDVERCARVNNGLRIEAAQSGQMSAAVKQTGIEEVGADAARFERELSKAQYTDLDGELQNFFFVRVHDIQLWLKSRGMIHGRAWQENAMFGAGPLPTTHAASIGSMVFLPGNGDLRGSDDDKTHAIVY